jgi:toxin ParE1/3/4
MRAVYLPAFWTDVVDAAEWFDQQRAGLGSEFVMAVDASIDRVISHPRSFRVVSGPVRRYIIRRFRHLIFYEVDNERVLFLGVVHGARDVNAWLRRHQG